MAITDNESAFVDSSAVSIGLSQMFTVTTGSTDPTYLVLSVLDRNEYTASASDATGSLSGNGNTLGLGGLSGDERGTGIVFTYTYNAATGQNGYYSSTYGWFNQLSYTSSSSAGDVTDLSLFGTSNAGLASLFGTNPYLLMEDDASGYLGGALVVTQPGYTATVPAQATPDSIASVAESFVGKAWNLNGCWVLTSTIAAEAGTSLPTQSTLVGLPGQANGEWIVAFNGPAGQTGNWQNMVTAGEMIVFEPAGGGGHVTTCVSGSGSTAMLVDNVEYVNGSGQIQNPANDGSSSDIIVAAPHPASQEWAGVAASTVVIYELDTPIVTATVPSDTLAGSTTQSLGSLFSVTDPANKAITAWQVYDTASSDSLVLGGTSYSDHSATTALSASTLGAVSLLAGATAATDTLEVRAYNGSYWGDWDALTVTITASDPLSAPVLDTQTPNQSWTGGTAVSLTLPATTFADPQGETLAYTATQQNGQALPGWLTFNAATDTFSGIAPATAQTLNLQVTATDTSGLSVSDAFSATVIGAPLLETQTPNQTWTGGTAVSLTLPAATFTDPQGEALAYTATQQNGQALPGWLTFNAATDTFGGIAPATAQTLNLQVIATDTSGLSVSDAFSATVIGAPLLETQTPNQTWTGGTAVSLTLPASTFADPQGEALVYSATQQIGQALPGWLTFNAATDTFSGIAPATAQTLNLQVTATDTTGLSVSDAFSATVIGAPLLETQTPNQTWTGGTAVSLTLPATTFADPQGETLVYTATQQNGQGLPGWLTFNAATDSFSGTAPTTAQTLNLQVTAMDTSGLSMSDAFSATVIGEPLLETQTPNQTWTAGGAVSFALPADTFSDPQGETLAYTAAQQTGQALPGWLTFNAATGTFSGIAAGTAQTLYLIVTAMDTSGLSVSDSFSAAVIIAPVYLTRVPTILTGGSQDEIFVATNNVLYSGDQITGGAGLNTLELQGGGTFDLRAPKVLNNIQVVDATEGQSAGLPTIYLRDGLDLTLNLASAPTNPQSSGAVIHGAKNNDVINLGSGDDTVYLGGTGETVQGGSGLDTYVVTSATIGATIVGGSGTDDLFVQGGGAMAMGTNITGMNNVFLPTAGTSYNFTANATLGLVIHAGADSDTIVAGDASQTVFGSSGNLLVQATAANAGLMVHDGTGSNTLEITTGGSIALNSALQNVTVDLDVATTLTLPVNPTVTIDGIAGDDVFVVTQGVLKAGQNINGGGSSNTLVAQGGGAFYLTKPATLTNIQVLDATEGQGTATPTIFLRDGENNLTLNLAAAATNPSLATAVVHGATNNDTINLGSGTDTVIVGSGETVNGGSGTDLYYVTTATIGSTIDGGSGTNNLYVESGGTAAMGANITGMNHVFLLNAGTAYNFTANATSKLVILAGADTDTITVGSASQIVRGSTGNLDVQATAANAGVSIDSGTGSNERDITTAGTVTLNGVDNNLTVQLDAANSKLTLDHMQFIQAEGTGGNDLIIAGAAGQTLTGGGTGDTLEDAGHYGVTFQDTISGIGGDTLADFTKVDTIDILGFGSALASAVYSGTYGTSGSGVLAVTNGTSTVDIKMAGLTSGASFHAASDLNGGTIITYS
jgi:Putative Ig domain